jgi:hypothetical protein
LRFPVTGKSLRIVLAILAAPFIAYLYLCARAVASLDPPHGYSDFDALWMSGVIAYHGEPALNYDFDGLYARQIEMGHDPHGHDPFPYPPTLLLLLAPLGSLGLRAAYALFMIPSFALYLVSMLGRRPRDWRWPLGACVAPASSLALTFGQTGFLSGALTIGGLRLAASRPILSGVLFGLLTFKPQLGVLVPFALVAAGLWRTIASALATVAVLIVASSLAFGPAIWLAWARSLVDYGRRFNPVLEYMPTLLANAKLLGAPNWAAWAAQICVSIPVIFVVGRAFRAGPTPRACALLLVGTFLATPHALHYDMPITASAAIWYLIARYDAGRGLAAGEIVILTLALILPLALVALRGSGLVFSFAPLLLLFLLIARPREAAAIPTQPRAIDRDAVAVG